VPEPGRSRRRWRLVFSTLLTLPLTTCASAAPSPPRADQAGPSQVTTASPVPPPAMRSASRLGARILESVPTDQADARGLELVGDVLVENTGSAIRAVVPSTGDVYAQREVPPDQQGNGIALTPAGLWQAGAGSAILRDPRTLAQRRGAVTADRSWGLCHDGTHLVESNGTTRLRLLDRDTAAPIGEVRVATREWSTARLGELHCTSVDGFPQVWAAVTGTDWMIRVDLVTGIVTAVADLTAITVAEQPTRPDQVIGGITAAPGAADELWLTGRHYRHRYRIRLQPRP
jgi:glutamine cyclotransferase